MARSRLSRSCRATRPGVSQLGSSASPRCPCAPIMTFSSVLMVPKGRGIWKVRPRPSATRAWAGSASTARPPRRIVPALGRWLPARQSNRVVLPAPFGPISPTISAGETVKDSPSTATLPPNRLTTCSTERNAPSPACGRRWPSGRMRGTATIPRPSSDPTMSGHLLPPTGEGQGAAGCSASKRQDRHSDCSRERRELRVPCPSPARGRKDRARWLDLRCTAGPYAIRWCWQGRAVADDTFDLFDLRVDVIVPEGAPIFCGARPGDHFELRGEMLTLPPGQGISIYSLAAVLPAAGRQAATDPCQRLDDERRRDRVPGPELRQPAAHQPHRAAALQSCRVDGRALVPCRRRR